MCDLTAPDSATLKHVLRHIDRANELDPNTIDDMPRARIEGERATTWLYTLTPDPTAELQVAARAHHLRRWELARASYPEGRAGYLRWRKANKAHQAASAREILEQHTIDEGFIARVSELLLRGGLGSDPETQRLEDVACLVFLQTQFDSFSTTIDADHLERVVAKTTKKMSGEAAALIDAALGAS